MLISVLRAESNNFAQRKRAGARHVKSEQHQKKKREQERETKNYAENEDDAVAMRCEQERFAKVKDAEDVPNMATSAPNDDSSSPQNTDHSQQRRAIELSRVNSCCSTLFAFSSVEFKLR